MKLNRSRAATVLGVGDRSGDGRTLGPARLALFFLLVTGWFGVTQAQSVAKAWTAGAIHQEKIEWTWSDHSDTVNPALPNVLLLGDSITRAYFPAVAQDLAGKANVYLFASSFSVGDPRLPGLLRDYFASEPTFKVVHFNNGMHGWAYTDAEFAGGLPSFVETIQKASPGSRFIWATITPVRKDDPAGASNARIVRRNAAALQIMKDDHIPVDDQYGLMLTHTGLHLDDVHFNDEGSRIQGEQAAKLILAALMSTKG